MTDLRETNTLHGTIAILNVDDYEPARHATVKALLRLARAEQTVTSAKKFWHTTFDLANDLMLLLDSDLKLLRRTSARSKCMTCPGMH